MDLKIAGNSQNWVTFVSKNERKSLEHELKDFWLLQKAFTNCDPGHRSCYWL